MTGGPLRSVRTPASCRLAWVRAALLLLTTSLLTAACSGGFAAAASLMVSVNAPSGLGDELPPMRLVGPTGEVLELRGSELLDDVAPGDYRLEAHEVAAGDTLWVALPPSVTFTVAPGAHVTVPVTYADAAAVRQLYPPAPDAYRPGARTFHVDCREGRDSYSGLSPDRAVRSLERAGRLPLRPGDRLLLRRGCAWEGPLTIGADGTAEWPVVVGAYGEGDAPTVAGARLNNVDVFGSHVVVEHLRAVTDPDALPRDATCRDQPVAWRTGFTVQHGAEDVTLRYVQAYGHTAGVHVTRGASHVRVLHADLRDNVVMSVNTNDGGFDDSGAWGVLINGSHVEVAYSTFGGNNAWCSHDFGQEGASVEIYEGVGSLVHHNLSVDDTTFSEIGSSSQRAARDNLFAFNVYSSRLPVSQFLVIRGDDAHFGPTAGTRVYFNTVFLPHPQETQGIVCYAGCGPELLDARNNVIWAEWKALYADDGFSESHNLFWNSSGRPLLQLYGEGSGLSGTSLVADPRFVDAAALDLRLRDDSPARGAGSWVDLGFAFDAHGTPLTPGQPVDIGAVQSARP